MARHQAWLFFPLVLLEALHLHVADVAWGVLDQQERQIVAHPPIRQA